MSGDHWSKVVGTMTELQLTQQIYLDIRGRDPLEGADPFLDVVDHVKAAARAQDLAQLIASPEASLAKIDAYLTRNPLDAMTLFGVLALARLAGAQYSADLGDATHQMHLNKRRSKGGNTTGRQRGDENAARDKRIQAHAAELIAKGKSKGEVAGILERLGVYKTSKGDNLKAPRIRQILKMSD